MTTPLTTLLGINHPVIQAGMARQYTSPALVAAVSSAGGLGILGCLDRSESDVVSSIRETRRLTDRPFGVNFVLHRLDERAFRASLAERVPVFSFFRGDDPSDAIARAHQAGATVIHQITTTEEAERAAVAGADVIVAQGAEAGGHCGPIPLGALLPDVLAAVGDRPVVAAGGIIDGRGLASALALGAAGVLMGTRFLATVESPATTGHKRAILAAGPGPTIASDRFDVLWGDERWPGVQGRALKNALTDQVMALSDSEFNSAAVRLQEIVRKALDEDDPDARILLAGMGASRIRTLLPAARVVEDVVRDAAGIGDTRG